MNSLNSILIEGTLVGKPIETFNPHGVAIVSFTIASDRFFKGKGSTLEKEVSNFEIEATGRLGETCLLDLDKDRGVRIVGRLHQYRWSDSDGSEPVYHSRIVVIAEHVEFKPMLKGEGDESKPELEPETWTVY